MQQNTLSAALFRWLWHLSLRFLLPRAISFDTAQSTPVTLVAGSARHVFELDSNGRKFPTAVAYFKDESGLCVGKFSYGMHAEIFQTEISGGLTQAWEWQAQRQGAEMALSVYKRNFEEVSAQAEALKEEVARLRVVEALADRVMRQSAAVTDGLDGDERELSVRLASLASWRRGDH